jgi:hypothetical protein
MRGSSSYSYCTYRTARRRARTQGVETVGQDLGGVAQYPLLSLGPLVRSRVDRLVIVGDDRHAQVRDDIEFRESEAVSDEWMLRRVIFSNRIRTFTALRRTNFDTQLQVWRSHQGPT